MDTVFRILRPEYYVVQLVLIHKPLLIYSGLVICILIQLQLQARLDTESICIKVWMLSIFSAANVCQLYNLKIQRVILTTAAVLMTPYP
jgi:hypothetical protein